MSIPDIAYLFQWWFMLFLLGNVFFPFISRLFPRFVDKGYIFSKILGIALVSYCVFLLGLARIMPFNRITSIAIALIVALTLSLSTHLMPEGGKKAFESFLKTIKSNWYIFFLEEILFLLALFFWSYIRSFSPDIHGLEKFMDFGFINSILRSEYFPPKDMWFTPFSINYYYFGHIVTAILTKFSQLPSGITFNLMVATIFAFCF